MSGSPTWALSFRHFHVSPAVLTPVSYKQSKKRTQYKDGRPLTCGAVQTGVTILTAVRTSSHSH
jgi:hypothetical protein